MKQINKILRTKALVMLGIIVVALALLGAGHLAPQTAIPPDPPPIRLQVVTFDPLAGEPTGVSFQYTETFGVTEQAYLADTQHLNSPNGLFIDNDDSLYVVEERGSRMLKFDSSKVNLLTLGTAGFQAVDANTFSRPKDIALDGSGNIWIVDEHRLTQYDADGNFLQVFPDWSQNPWDVGIDNQHFNTPRSLAFDNSGNMYVADTDNNRIQVYTFVGGNPVYETTITGFNSPFQIAFDSSGRLYVADSGNYRIQRCIFAGSWSCSTFHGTGSQGSGDNELDWVAGLGLRGNNLYIADSGNNRIKQCDINSGDCFIFALWGLKWPADVAIDSVGNVYVSDADNFVIRKFNNLGLFVETYLGTIGIPYDTDFGHFNTPYGLAVDSGSNIYLSTDWGYRLLKLAPGGLGQWSVGKAGRWDMDNSDDISRFGDWWAGPRSVAIDVNGKIYVADTGNHRIQIFNSNGGYITTLGSYGTGDDQFDGPSGVAVDKNGNIYVSDTNNHRVQIYNSSLVHQNTLGETGVSGADGAHFNRPLGVTVDNNGNIYVADSDNNRVQIFNSNRAYIFTLGVSGEWGNDNAHFSNPFDVAIDTQSRIYVADAWNNRIQVFNSSGIYLTTIGGEWGNNVNQFRGAVGVDVDTQDNVYVADSGNHRVQKFASVGFSVYLPIIIGKGSGGQQPGAPTLVNPSNGSIQAKPRFDWTDVAGATNYRFQMSTSNTFDVLTINQIVTGSEFTFLSNLTGIYYWRVYTIGSNGTSPSSEVRTVQLVNYSGDDDRDSLLNGWELHGYDPNNDGSPEVNLPALGASYRHKDIFVEMDYMTRASAANGLGPNQAVLDEIVVVFNNAAVSNPDGIDGIKIHLELDDEVPYDDDLNPVNDEFYALKNIYFNPNRAAVYHYMIWGDQYSGTTSSGLSFGIPATDLIVTLGAFEGGNGGTDEQKIGTFIHELGHNLGLGHGGSDHVNYKPNYLSIMSYQWQLSGVWRNGQYEFDYQPFSLPALNENNLDEPDGLNGGGAATGYWTKRYCDNTGFYEWAQADIAIDWNCDGDSDDTSIVVDTNNDTYLSTLSSHNDWMNINYSGGGIIGSGRSPSELLSQSENYVDPHLDELTYELYLEQLKHSSNTPPNP